MKLIVKKINFFPHEDINSKGFLGFINAVLGDEEEDLICLNSFGVYTTLRNSNHKIKLTSPAKSLGSGYKFYYRILNEELFDEIIKAAEEELKRLNYFGFKKVDLSETGENKYEQNNNAAF